MWLEHGLVGMNCVGFGIQIQLKQGVECSIGTRELEKVRGSNRMVIFRTLHNVGNSSMKRRMEGMDAKYSMFFSFMFILKPCLNLEQHRNVFKLVPLSI